MRKLVLGLWVLIAASCGVDSSEIGTDFFNDGALDYSYMDTSTVALSTIQFDNLQTSGTDRLLVGSHNDEKMGRITASSYFQVSPSEWVDLEEEDVTYDYLALTLQYDQYYYYDTAALLTLHAYYVTEEMENEPTGVLYNDNTFEVAGTPLGSLTFAPKPNRADSVEIRLSDTLGRELFEMAKDGRDELQSTAAFLRYFRGLAIIPDSSTSTAMIGFAKTPQLRLYYKDRSATPITQKYKSFTPSGTNIVFTNIHTNRAETLLRQLPSSEERLPATYTDDVAFMQAGGGLALRVDFPYLRDLRQLPNFYVMSASLEIYPVRKSYDDNTPMPSSLIVYKANIDNAFYETFENKASLSVDADLGRDTKYTLNVTSFVKEQMGLAAFNENGLVMMMENNFSISADRLYAARKGAEYKTRLRIYYATVNNE